MAHHRRAIRTGTGWRQAIPASALAADTLLCNHPRMGYKRKLRFKTIFMSDVHLGTRGKAAQASHFLPKLALRNSCSTATSLMPGRWRWTVDEAHFVRTVLEEEKENDAGHLHARQS